MNALIVGQYSGEERRQVQVDIAGRLLLGTAGETSAFAFADGAGGAYAAGQSVGGAVVMILAAKVDYAADVGIMLQSVSVVEQVAQAAAATLLFFSTDPTAVVNPATATDHVAFAWGAGTAWQNFIGRVDISPGDFTTLDGKAIAVISGLGMMLRPSTIDGKVYAVWVTRGTPTYGLGKQIQVRLGFQKA